MKYIKHIILTAFAMVVMMGAWAQTVPTQQSNGTWQFTMPDANKLLEVNYGLVLTVGPNVVASSESGLIDNHNGTYTVDNGTTVILTATPAEHYHLASWSNGATVNTHDTIHVTVTKDTTVTATFAPNTYSLTLGTDPTEGGSVFFTGYPLQTVTWVCEDIAPTLNLSSQYPSQGNSNHATIDGVTVTCNRGIVEPSNNGYYLRIYSYYNSNHPSLNDIVFTCPDGKTFTKMVINFIGANGSYYTPMPGATLSGNMSSGGSITWIGNATSIGYGSNLYVSSIEFTLSDGLPDGVQATSMENVYSVEYDTEVDLTAAPNDHYHFVKWTDQHSTAMGTSEQLQFTFTKDSTITGNFAIDTFELSFGPLSSSQEAIDAHGWVTIDAVPAGVVQKVENSSPVPGTYKVPYGTKITLKAIPDADYHLQSWAYTEPSMPHVEDFEEDTTTITVTGAQTVTGNFAIDSSRIDSVRLTWQVQIGNADPISPKPYVTENPTAADTMGYVMIPIGAEFLIIPSDAQKEFVSKLELIENIENVVDLDTISTDFVAQSGDILINALSEKHKISIADGATITLRDASINESNIWQDGLYAGITCEGNATIILSGTNTVKGFDARYPGIFVPAGKTLIIKGDGSLTSATGTFGAYGDAYGCGIGGVLSLNKNSPVTCGNIEIQGGTITAIGGNESAGIGSGARGYCGSITISGGNVTATSNGPGAAIGSGYQGDCGNILISGGTVNATGGTYGPGIGCGSSNGWSSSCGTITISGGTVTARGGDYATGIGTGYSENHSGSSSTNPSCGNIYITTGAASVTVYPGGGDYDGWSSGHFAIGAGYEATYSGTIYIGGVDKGTSLTGNPWVYPEQ